MIRIALIALVFILPGAIVGGLILAIFPHISAVVLDIITAGIIMWIAYAYVRRRKNHFEREGIPEQTPQWLSKKRYLVFLAVGTLIGGSIVFSTNKTTLYIDNGSDNVITVTLKHEGTIKVNPHSYVTETVVIGDNEGTVNGRKVKMDISEAGNWVWNVNGTNRYLLTSVSYSSNTSLYKDGIGPADDSDEDYKLIKDEFFNSKADYMFKAPETISIKKSRFSTRSADVTKTVLYRIDGKDDEETAEAPPEEDKQSDQ